jgi:hypothetical protein
MSRPKLSIGYSQRGADMGRAEIIPDDKTVKVKMYLRPILVASDGGCYDEGGAYWGSGLQVYWAHAQLPEGQYAHTGSGQYESQNGFEHIDLFYRARDRHQAKHQIWKLLPNATFYR